MTMQEYYKAIGGNYEAVLGRLHSEALIQRFTLKFLEDQSYLQLKQALENKNYEDAFRSAHTLKGVWQNLSFDRLLVNWHKLAVEYNYSKSTAEAVAKIFIKMLWGYWTLMNVKLKSGSKQATVAWRVGERWRSAN